jgi:hypothetical protein
MRKISKCFIYFNIFSKIDSLDPEKNSKYVLYVCHIYLLVNMLYSMELVF